MVLVRRSNDLGVAISQYCFGRSIAERFQYEQNSMPIAGFPGTRVKSHGKHMLSPEVVWSGNWPFDIERSRPLQIQELHQAPGARLKLIGEFQRYDLIASRKEDIRNSWLVEGRPKNKPSVKALCIALEFSTLNPHCYDNIPSISELRKLTATLPKGLLHIITNDVNNPFLNAFSDLKPEIHSGTDIEMLFLLSSFDRIAFSQSTLYWWGAFLGSASEIYFPSIKTGIWAHPAPSQSTHEPYYFGIDLRVTDEDRWIYT